VIAIANTVAEGHDPPELQLALVTPEPGGSPVVTALVPGSALHAEDHAMGATIPAWPVPITLAPGGIRSLILQSRGVLGPRFEAGESRLRKALALFEQEPRRGQLLDVAAGSGIAASALADQGWKVSAVDISDELVEQIRSRVPIEALTHDLAAGPLPFDDGSFDAVFAGEILEHLVDTGGFLAELCRVMRPGGIAVLTTPNLASLENRMRLAVGRYPIWVEYELGGQGHVRAYTLPALRAQLRRHGFRVERELGNWVPVLPQRIVNDLRMPALARTGDWFPSLSQTLIVQARRV
jgi:ubiquinone/menaquinone biosynthesis C-methylase UbiE